MEAFYDEVKKLIELENYDYVISENITPPIGITFLQGHSLVNRLKKTKNPLESFLYNFRKVKKERIKYQAKWMKQGYRKIFVVSELHKRDIIENFNIEEEKISVVYPGVDVPEKIEQPAPHSPMIFGLLAPGFKIKGGFVLIEALKILKQKGYDFTARVIYPKHAKNLGVRTLVKLYNLTDNIEFLPQQKDIYEFYRSVDCLLAPSLEDTFNMAVLEAMAYSKPCIVSKNAGVHELISDGINGFTFEIGKNNRKSAENLAGKMAFLIDNCSLYPKLSASAYHTAEEYSWDRAYKRFLADLP
jgi:UDP-glucose:(heptosyl)LPS alpha-1,3-glucosyltransferase